MADGRLHKSGFLHVCQGRRAVHVATCIVGFAANLIPRTAKSSLRFGNKGACTTICKDILAKHQPSSIHREALEHKHACHVFKTMEGIKEAMQGKVVLQRDHVIGAMKCLYWTCKPQISHNFSLPPFRQQKNTSV